MYPGPDHSADTRKRALDRRCLDMVCRYSRCTTTRRELVGGLRAAMRSSITCVLVGCNVSHMSNDCQPASTTPSRVVIQGTTARTKPPKHHHHHQPDLSPVLYLRPELNPSHHPDPPQARTRKAISEIQPRAPGPKGPFVRVVVSGLSRFVTRSPQS